MGKLNVTLPLDGLSPVVIGGLNTTRSRPFSSAARCGFVLASTSFAAGSEVIGCAGCDRGFSILAGEVSASTPSDDACTCVCAKEPRTVRNTARQIERPSRPNIQRCAHAVNGQISRGPRMPTIHNAEADPNTIAVAFDKNNSVAPSATFNSNTLSESPTVAIGGTSDVAIAMPGNTESKCGRPNAYAATTPLMKATAKSSVPGAPRLDICSVTPDVNSTRNRPTAEPVSIATRKPRAIVLRQRWANRRLP
jgi:hypothetical protein